MNWEEYSQMIWAPDKAWDAWDWGAGAIATACPAAIDVLAPLAPGTYITATNGEMHHDH